MDEGRRAAIHLGADVVHLLAAGAWVGAIAAFVRLATRRRVPAEYVAAVTRALTRFAAAGTWMVTTLTLSGLVNAWLLIGPTHLPTLTTTTYGRLLLTKLSLFAVMLILASVHRFGLTPLLARRLAETPASTGFGALRWTLIAEAGCATLALALVVWLGTLSPLG